MAKKSGGLGRGLGALIPTSSDSASDTEPSSTQLGTVEPGTSEPGTALPVPGTAYAELPLLSITPNPRQPRQYFDEDDLAELVFSIREIGLLQPIVVRPTGPGSYEIVAGERRWRASQVAGLDPIPAIIRETSDDDILRDALLENLHRAQLGALEEAAAYAQLLSDFGCTQEELAQRLGRSRPQIANTMRLLKLPVAVQMRVAAGVLTAGHARALLSLPDEEVMDIVATRIVAEGLSVRSVEEIVAIYQHADQPRQRKSRAKGSDPAVQEAIDALRNRLEDRLDTRVQIVAGKSKGKVTITFSTVEDLARIADLIDPA